MCLEARRKPVLWLLRRWAINIFGLTTSFQVRIMLHADKAIAALCTLHTWLPFCGTGSALKSVRIPKRLLNAGRKMSEIFSSGCFIAWTALSVRKQLVLRWEQNWGLLSKWKARALKFFPKPFVLPSLRFWKLWVCFFSASCFDLVLVLNAKVVEVEQLKSTQRCSLSNVMCCNTRWHSRT